VEGDVLLPRVDVDVVAQPVQQLRAVGLRVYRLHLDAFEILPLLRTVRLGTEIDAAHPFPDAGEAAQRAQIGQGFGVDIFGFGEDVVRNIHVVVSLCQHRNHSQ